jgi:hypothetical protein
VNGPTCHCRLRGGCRTNPLASGGFKGEIALIERGIAEHALGSQAIKRLMTVPGVSLMSATTFIAAVGDIRRFPNPRKLAGYLGLDPKVRQSGAFYERVRARRGSQIAIVAVARKLAVLFWHLRHARPTEPIPPLLIAHCDARQLGSGLLLAGETSSATMRRGAARHSVKLHACGVQARWRAVATGRAGSPPPAAAHAGRCRGVTGGQFGATVQACPRPAGSPTPSHAPITSAARTPP